MIAAERVVEIARQRLSELSDPLQVFWCRVEEESRLKFAEQLRESRASLPLIPIILRQQLFFDPNAILSDLNQLLSESRDELIRCAVPVGQPVAIVILARGEFRLAQTGSLIVLPDWFPHIGGNEIFVRVRDLLIDLEVTGFNAPEARADDVAARLHELESAIVKRLESVFASDPRKLDSIWSSLSNATGVPVGRIAIAERLKTYREHVQNVQDPRGYRPSLKSKQSLLADWLTLIQRSSPDQLRGLAGVVAAALDVDEKVTCRLPMLAIMLRPTTPMEPAMKFGHSLLASLYGGYQFLNATAHAGDYPPVAVAFLYFHSRDLRLAIQHSAEQLAS